jgi:NAD(P)-dependent dehydrogenase (short-subunit alcohol dehydrogenase family)
MEGLHRSQAAAKASVTVWPEGLRARVRLSSSTAETRPKTEEVAHDIIAQGGRAYVVIGDLTNDDEVQRLVDEAQVFVKPVEILINNAGGSGETEDRATTRPESWVIGYETSLQPRLLRHHGTPCRHLWLDGVRGDHCPMEGKKERR